MHVCECGDVQVCAGVCCVGVCGYTRVQVCTDTHTCAGMHCVGACGYTRVCRCALCWCAWIHTCVRVCAVWVCAGTHVCAGVHCAGVHGYTRCLHVTLTRAGAHLLARGPVPGPRRQRQRGDREVVQVLAVPDPRLLDQGVQLPLGHVLRPLPVGGGLRRPEASLGQPGPSGSSGDGARAGSPQGPDEL